jgi:nitroimidazol reductase NimA-like FMN-containing flavoprotein (pyridoxamine 5'-phosphate oxidase superfamily)
MPKDYDQLPNTEMRRADRQVNDEAWIADFLSQAPVGVLATSQQEQPFINSNLFAYDKASHQIYMHTANTGRTKASIAANPKVCFHVFEMGRFLPADEALEFSVEYAGVTIFGEASLVEKDADQEHALQLILDKYAPHLRPDRDYRPITPEEIKRTTVYKIAINEWSAKKKEESPDFPGAYLYPPPKNS